MNLPLTRGRTAAVTGADAAVRSPKSTSQTPPGLRAGRRLGSSRKPTRQVRPRETKGGPGLFLPTCRDWSALREEAPGREDPRTVYISCGRGRREAASAPPSLKGGALWPAAAVRPTGCLL